MVTCKTSILKEHFTILYALGEREEGPKIKECTCYKYYAGLNQL